MQHLRKLTTALSLANLRKVGINEQVINISKRSRNLSKASRYQHYCSSSFVNVSENKQKKFIEVEWENGESSKFANIFLRDHCRCPKCFDKYSSNRLLEAYTVPLDVAPDTINIIDSSLIVNWSDNHVSEYTFDYLKNVQKGLHNDVRYLPPKLWRRKDLEDGFPVYSLKEIVENEEKMLNWFLDLKQIGVAMIEDAGTSFDVLDYCRDKLFGGYYKTTHYGHTFKVITKRDANNRAFTSEALFPHVDLPHFHHMPGIQILHCLVQTQSQGGDSILVDGFQAAEQLKTSFPDSFEFLTQYKVRYRDIGSDYFGEFETFCERPIIQLNEDGTYEGIYHIGFQRDYGNHGSVEEIQMFYESMHRYTHLLLDPDNQYCLKLKPGNILVFDNTRLLHGRTGFQANPQQTNEKLSEKNEEQVDRCLHGCYLDWDQIYLKYRPIKRRVESQKGNMTQL